MSGRMMTQDEALEILKTGANVFLTGEPGSGKTHTVNGYVAWLREHDIEPAITASTGIAATHIGGYTIHSWSGIGIKSALSEEDLDRLAQNERLVRRARLAHVLIIDEISMLSTATFAAADAACRALRARHEPFGGLQVVLVGDFFQLPPVVKRGGDEEEGQLFGGEDDPRTQFSFMSPTWKQLNPVVCYLSEQHRQEDTVFLEILSAVRNGSVREEHRATLLSRRPPARKPAGGGAGTELYSHNVDVDRVNDTALAKLAGEPQTFDMERHGSEKLVAQLVKGCLSPETLVLKEGARVMFTKNNFQEGFVNGTTGVVVGFDEYSGYPIVETKSGKRIVAEPMEWAIEEGGRAVARLVQVPLRLAWAITVHKSQGMSLDTAHMDLSDAFEYGQGYVALSRVRTLEGLSLVGMNEQALMVHPDIAEKDEEFRAASDAARKGFTDITPAEMSKIQKNFVKSCGGKESKDPQERSSKEDPSTLSAPQRRGEGARGAQRWRATYELLVNGRSLEEVAIERGRKVETILEHLEQLAQRGELDVLSLSHLARGLEDDLGRADTAFRKAEHAYLKPVFEELEGKVPYTTIRLARLLGKFPLPPRRDSHD